MEALRKFVIALTGWVIIVSVSIGVMLFGWGLSPKNWAIVIVGNSAGFLLGQFFIALSKSD